MDLLRVFVASWLVASLLLLGAAGAAAQYAPARLKSGEAPAPPPNLVGWGWIVGDETVIPEGRLNTVGGGWGTPGLDSPFWVQVANTWSFEPAREGDVKVESQVLIAACYRPASLAMGPESAAPDVRVALPKPDVPVPTTMVPPVYPPRALGDGVVIVELAIDASGAVKNTRVVRSAGGFDAAALDAARVWRFQPAQRAGAAVPAYVYLIFGFRQPVT